MKTEKNAEFHLEWFSDRFARKGRSYRVVNREGHVIKVGDHRECAEFVLLMWRRNRLG